MKHRIDIINRQRKLSVTKELKDIIITCCEAAIDCEGIDFPCAVDVTLVSNRTIRQYNRQYREIDRATDVLSFPLGDGERFEADPETGEALLGDIVISLERAAEQARQYGHSYEREVGFLTVHSMLHLMGYDHIDEAEGDVMRAREKVILEKIGLLR